MLTCFRNELKEKYKEAQNILKKDPNNQELLNTIETIEINLSKERIPGDIEILLEYDYLDLKESKFLWNTINDLANIKIDNIENITLRKQKFTLKEITEILNEFFKKTNNEIYNIFLKIYQSNKSSLRYIEANNYDYTGEIIYLEYFKKYYIMATKENTIEDILTFAHEFGHAIQYYLNYNTALYNKLNVYIEIVSTFFELICNEYLLNYFIDEGTITSYTTLRSHLLSAKSINNELILLNAIKSDNIKAVRKNISELIEILEKKEIDNLLMERPATDYIYVIAFNIATNLFMVYKSDPNYAFYLLNKIINIDLKISPEEYFNKLNKMDITSIDKTKQYSNLILKRTKLVLF